MKRIEDITTILKVAKEINHRIYPLHLSFFLKDTDAVIFGGAVRNAISGDHINDIDIVCYEHAFDIIDKKLVNDLSSLGYTEKEDVSLSDEYSDLVENSQIQSVFNYHFTQNGNGASKSSLIQLIVINYPEDKDLVGNIQKFVSSVDIRACAMLFAPMHDTLLECIPGAFEDCKRKRIFVNRDAIMYYKPKCEDRIKKFKALGWKVVN